MAKFKYTAQRGLSLLGDEKGAWMVSTIAETVVASELVVNGDFAAALGAEWTLAGITDGSITTVSGELKFDQGATAEQMTATQGVATVIGASYVFSANVKTNSSGATALRMLVGTSPTSGGIFDSGYFSETGTRQSTFVAVGTTTFITLRDNQALANTSTWDNASVRLSDADVSDKEKDGVIYGSLIKAPVVVGASLMGWSNFSTSNYWGQAYNSDLDFGLGDFCFAGWVNLDSFAGNGQLIETRDAASTEGVAVHLDSDGRVNLITVAALVLSITTGNASIVDDGWKFLVCKVTNSGTTHSIYIDGVLDKSATVIARTIGGIDASLLIGVNAGRSIFAHGAMTMWRVFAYAPTAAQIKTIYNKEKHLFKKYSTYTQEGVEYTLNVGLQSANRTRKTIKNEKVTLSGRRQSIVHRNEIDWNITTGFVHRTDTTEVLLSAVDEFIYSTQASETFTCDIYDESVDKSMVMVSANVSDARQGNTDWFTASFKMQESNQ